QLALQVARERVVGARLVVVLAGARVTREQTLVLLAPEETVRAVVVIARTGDRDLEEVRVAENRVGGGESAAGMAVDADAVDVDPLVARGELADRGDVIRDAV